jgi:signal transduction histidine kinase
VVAHSVSVKVIQTGGVRHSLAAGQAREREALERVERVGREALDELRRMLGILRSSDEQPSLAPQPGLSDLAALADQMQTAGLPVDLRVTGGDALPAGIGLTVYRIVQEALTNVVKHARTSACQVLIGYGRDELVLEVTDNGAGLPAMALAGDVPPHHGLQDAIGGSGHGLIGMRERVSLLSGEFSAGPLPGYGFQVSAHIPLPQGK